ncbi:DNA adenine methylase [Ferroplasma acidarmanus]|uniref:site-specific DNA-methyltransferase (adenine-specific) n=1 Tax=Ferroplasma acidarmanus Fer1 TaxID=333146 RepID=S0AR40_FERAC|nr:hypothetical protein FACI_IFERC00001G1436 [Ferroplasma acidarmanus Fer1]
MPLSNAKTTNNLYIIYIYYNVESLLDINYKPVLKWAGGKRQLLNDLIKYIPNNFNEYYEPFIGGGSFLIKLYSMDKISNAVISDLNTDLYNLYVTIKSNPYALINELKDIEFKNNSKDYYKARELFNSTGNLVSRSALLIYLNKHCYNGLYRVNSQNKFNVPYGKYANPGMPIESDILGLSNLFQKCTILNEDFEEAVKTASKGDFVYFDPPYMPVNKTSNFTGYTSNGFYEKDQERLYKVFKRLSSKGVYVMESNSDTDFIKNLYKDFNLIEVTARRSINSIGTKRGIISELIITNYGVQ